MPRGRRPRPHLRPPAPAARSPSRDADTSSGAQSARQGADQVPTANRPTDARRARVTALEARVQEARAEHVALITRTALLDAREREVAAAEAALATARAGRASVATLDPLLCDAVDALRGDHTRPAPADLATAALADAVVAAAFAAGDGARALAPPAAAALATRLSVDVSVGPAAGTRVSLADMLHWPATTIIQTVAAAKAEIRRAFAAAATTTGDGDAVAALAAIDDAGAAARALNDLFVAVVTYRHASVGTVARAQLLAAGEDGGSGSGDAEPAADPVSAATLVDRLAIFSSPRQVGALLAFRAAYVRRVAAARARRGALLATLRGTLLTGSVGASADAFAPAHRVRGRGARRLRAAGRRD